MPAREAGPALERVLKGIDDSNTRISSQRHLRIIRAVEVLERIGGPEAKALLSHLATGLDNFITREAALALKRL